MCFRVLSDHIILHQFLQKVHRTGSVCQCMINFKINPILIIGYFKKQCFFIRYIEPAAWRLFFFCYHRFNLSSLQIKPEQPLSQHCLKQWIFLHSLIQCFLQDLRIYRFFTFTVKPKHSGVVLSGHQWKCQRCVIQLSPS